MMQTDRATSFGPRPFNIAHNPNTIHDDRCFPIKVVFSYERVEVGMAAFSLGGFFVLAQRTPSAINQRQNGQN